MNKILDYIKYGALIIIAGILLTTGYNTYNTVEDIAKEKIVENNPSSNLGYGTFVDIIPLMDAVTATTTSSTLPQALFSKDYVYIGFIVETTDDAEGTLKFTGTSLDTPTDPTTTSTITNQWTNLEVVDEMNGTSYDGDTGIVVSGTDIHKSYRLNVDITSWTMPILTNYTTGTFYVYAVARTDY